MIDLDKWKDVIADMQSTDPQQRSRAMQELALLGPSVIPELLHETERSYRAIKAFDNLSKRKSVKNDAEKELAFIRDEIQKRLALVDKGRCPECSHILELHMVDHDNNTTCNFVTDSSITASEVVRFCECHWRRNSLHVS